MRRVVISLAAASLLSTAAEAQSVQAASAELKDKSGNAIGTVALRETASGGVWLNASLQNLPAGTHAFHIHETGKCEGDFKSAGGHYAPKGNKHGVLVEGGAHAGDLPNIHVADDGRLHVEIFAPDVSLKKDSASTLFDDDGSAIVIHEGVDDYKSQPSGDAGARIGCGVVTNKTIE